MIGRSDNDDGFSWIVMIGICLLIVGIGGFAAKTFWTWANSDSLEDFAKAKVEGKAIKCKHAVLTSMYPSDEYNVKNNVIEVQHLKFSSKLVDKSKCWIL